ncbi:MAG: hypothetical protein KGI27_14140 [Thaumarchaeota archaeon]|nr:hypothetical protein [Nitrososphaerota archaeon]
MTKEANFFRLSDDRTWREVRDSDAAQLADSDAHRYVIIRDKRQTDDGWHAAFGPQLKCPDCKTPLIGVTASSDFAREMGQGRCPCGSYFVMRDGEVARDHFYEEMRYYRKRTNN